MSLLISETLRLPLDWIRLSTIVYGARGAGKTTLGSVIAEEVYREHQRFCAIDLKGDWWGLKSSADGKSMGIPVVIFGGDHADLPLEPESGAFIAETIAVLDQPSILDLENLSKGKQIRFLAAFFERLYDKNREPLLLLLDEAQRYAPQRPMSPEAGICLGAVEDIVKLGRKHGIGPVLFTQRGSGLNKEVSELCDMLIAFRTPGPLDQDRIKDWLDANATREQRDLVMGQLAKQPTGTAVFASGHPDLDVFQVAAVRRRSTFDSSATPAIGKRRTEPKLLAQPDLEALREKMTEAIERAKADDPKELRKEIARLRAELAQTISKPPERVEVERIVEKIVQVPVIAQRVREAMSLAAEMVEGQIGGLQDIVKGLRDVAESPDQPLAEVIPIDHQPGPTIERIPLAEHAARHRPMLDRAQRSSTQLSVAENGAKPGFQPDGSFVYTLTKGEQAFLGILAQYPQGRSQNQLAVLAGYSPKSGGNGTILANLRKMSAVEGTASLLRITAQGREILGDNYEPLPTGPELRSYWLAKLAKGESTFLRLLFEVYPDSLAQSDLAEAAGYSPKSGGIGTILANLRKRDLIVGSAAALTASADLFQ